MTQTTLIIVNAILGTAVTYGVLGLLLIGIGSDRGVRNREVEKVRRIDRDRLAA
jgi:hypothetical protein